MKPEFWWRKEWGVPPARSLCAIVARLDIGTHEFLKREARSNGRTISGQVWYYLAKIARENSPDPYIGVWEAHDAEDDDATLSKRQCTHARADRQVQTRSRIVGAPIKRRFRTHCIRCGSTGQWSATVEAAYMNL